MPDITITLTAAQLQRFIDASAKNFNYDEYVARGGTQTKAQHTRAMLIRYIINLVHDMEADTGRKAAEAAVPDFGNVS